MWFTSDPFNDPSGLYIIGGLAIMIALWSPFILWAYFATRKERLEDAKRDAAAKRYREANPN